jgi:uncharacterized RmlC-like cupin family protein
LIPERHKDLDQSAWPRLPRSSLSNEPRGAACSKSDSGARTGIHRHGEQQTVAYVLSGTCDVRRGTKGEYTARAYAGDFVHVPAFLPHMEINPSETEPFEWVVVRSTWTPIVVSLPDWPGNAEKTNG